MSEVIDQATGGDASGGGGPTPLADILGSNAADVPASTQESAVDAFGEATGDLDREPRDRGQVPHAALHAERMRRKRVDARVRELEEELQRFNDQRYGLDDDPAPTSGGSEQAEDPAKTEWLKSYNKNLSDFTTKHGKERVAAIDAVLPRLTPSQKADVMQIAGTSRNPIEEIQAYIEQQGMLDPAFQRMSLQDVLAGKKQPEPGAARQANHAAAFAQREQALAAAERRVTFTASRSEFVAEHGRASYRDLDAASEALLQSGDPAAAEYAKAVASSADPVGTAAHLLSQWGLWQPKQQPPQQQQPRTIFPSNVAAARNVGVRNGPPWAGPTPLKDIFDRRTPQQ